MATPTPPIAVDAAEQALTVVIDLYELRVAVGAFLVMGL
jgi:hypothetical protein